MADVDGLLRALTIEEKAALTAGDDLFSTVAVERLGIPKVRVTDGPNGARGAFLPGSGGAPSTCVPCGSALGATWDPATAEMIGALVGREALDRGCRGLLAPTVNLHRSLLSGRNFECFSEDPYLSGRLAVGYVRGVQSQGVFATVKHLVGNEAEFERATIDSVIDERALRELYLVPFEMAVRAGGAHAVMTSYNRLNGLWLTQRADVLTGLLRDEWGFEGLVMTDWFAVVDRVDSLRCGLDLEMPGPGRALGAGVAESIASGEVAVEDLDRAVRSYLSALERAGALDGPTPPPAPQPLPEDDRARLRAAAADAAVLLRNDGTLPIDPRAAQRLAVIGAPARAACIMGGGSAQVTPRRRASPLDRLHEACAGAEIVYERGCEIDRTVAVLGGPVLGAPDGFTAEIFAGPGREGPPAETRRLDELRMVAFSGVEKGLLGGDWSMRVRGTVLPEESGRYRLALAQAGRARLLLDGEVLLDGYSDPPRPGGSDLMGLLSQDLVAEVDLTAAVPVELVVEFDRASAGVAGFRVGFATVDGGRLLERAEEAAATADVAVVFVGTTHEWEGEGRDRERWALPGAQDELVRRVARANPRTVVVVNSGAPVDLAWADEVAAVVQVWFGGEEMDGAVADVLTGRAEPGGRLPTSIPRRLEHVPSHGNFPGENGQVRYGEGLFMGYRGYDLRGVEVRYPFGHGLSYTSFEYGPVELSSPTFRPGETLRVSVPVTNTGTRPGSDVVQCYVAPGAARLARPAKELKGFVKVRVDPGQTVRAEIDLDDRSFAYWDPGRRDRDDIKARIDRGRLGGLAPLGESREPGWQVDPGAYDLLIGSSSADITARVTVTVEASTPST
ncbi:MAG: glycoside hydrolase family 3 C-terminal domain-containing protein [Acidobacteriota bacterium]|nr:glycoside hydrolase family 3 C-terminal domain-containing protein [Acidobacteriota bacterium]